MDRPTQRSIAVMGLVAAVGVGAAVLAAVVAQPPVTPSEPEPAEPVERSAQRRSAHAPGPIQAPPPPDPIRSVVPAPAAPLPAPDPAPSVDPIADAERRLDDLRDAGETTLDRQLSTLDRAGVDAESQEQARAILEMELEHQLVLRRDQAIGGLDPIAASSEQQRIQDLADDELDTLLGTVLRERIRNTR